jgi:hypothetical protein
MDKETILVFGIIGIVFIVLGFIVFSWLTTPLNQVVEGENTIFSLEDCEKAGFTKDDCLSLSPTQLKKVLRKKSG